MNQCVLKNRHIPELNVSYFVHFAIKRETHRFLPTSYTKKTWTMHLTNSFERIQIVILNDYRTVPPHSLKINYTKVMLNLLINYLVAYSYVAPIKHRSYIGAT